MTAVLLYAGVSAAALVLAHRLIRPLRRRTAILLSLLPLLFTGSALLTGRVYAPIDLPYLAPPLKSHAEQYGIERIHNAVLADIYAQMIPWKKVVREAWLSGEWPLWNPYLLAGDVLAASAQSAPYDPFLLLSLIVPLPSSLTFLATVLLFAAALAMFLFLRELGCREEASLLGAAAWTFGDALVLWLEWPLGATWRLLPLVLLGVRLCVHARAGEPALLFRTRRGAVAFLALAVAVAIFQGHPETVLHIVAIAAVWGLWEIGRLAVRERPGAFGRAAAGGLLGALLASVFLIPVIEAVPQTVQHHYRSETYRHEKKSLAVAPASKQLLVNFVPFRYGWSRQSERATDVDFEGTPNTAYAGLLLFPLAILGAVRSRARERPLLFVLLFVGWALGSRFPPLPDLIGFFPLFDVAINDRMVVLAIFALATLAALGVDDWLRRGGSPTLPGAVATTAVMGGIAVAVLWPAMIRSGLSVAFLVEQSILYLVPPAVAAIALPFSRTRRDAFALLMLAFLSQRTLEVADEYPTLPARAFYPPFAGLELFPRDEAPYRIAALDYTLIPQTAAMYGLEDIRGYQAMTNARLWQTMPFWSEFQPFSFNVVTDLRWPFLSFLNVRYVIAEPDAEPPEGWRVAGETRVLRLFQNERVLPRAFVPPRIRINTPEERLLDEMNAEQDFGERAWIAHFGGGAPAAELPNGPGRASTVREGLGRFRISVTMDAPGWLVVSETNWKGWRAHHGDRRIPIRRANNAFLGMYLEKGIHEIDLLYRPRSFLWGLGISIAAALAIAAMLSLAQVRPRT